VNDERSQEAAQRIWDAIQELKQRGAEVTVTAIAPAAGAHKATVAKALGTSVHTPNDLLNKGVNRLPKFEEEAAPSTAPLPSDCPADEFGRVPCDGGCGRCVLPGQKCTECADKAVIEWKQRRRLKRASGQ
jgi:hypothetical protein